MAIDEFKPGQRVRIVHTIERGDVDWKGAVVGVIQAIGRQKTGSWYAHSQDGKFWLHRIRLRKDDGEITVLNIDPRTEIELLDDAAAGP